MSNISFTPQLITKKRRLQLLAGLLMLALISSATYYLTLPDTTNATTTYTWDSTSDFAGGTNSSTTVNTFEEGVTLALKGTPVTDTTEEDFFVGNLSYLSPLNPTVLEEEGLVEISQGYMYTKNTNPPVDTHNRHTNLAPNGLLYISSDIYADKAVSVINTQNTYDPSDDVLVNVYSTTSVPAIANDQVLHTNLTPNGLLYVGTRGGLSVINTQNTIDPSDDTFVITYSTVSSPSIGHNLSNDSYVTDDGLLYVSTWGGGLSVINTQNTIDPLDDTIEAVYTMSTSPALGHNSVTHSFFDGDLLYIGTEGGGLTVIDTQGTATSTDDLLVTTYSTSSDPAIANDSTRHAIVAPNGLLYVTTRGGGLTVIDTKRTQDPSDDELVTNYSTESSPALPGDWLENVKLTEEGLLYIGGSSLLVIDTQNTIDPSDDKLFKTYSFNSSPAIADPYVFDFFITDENIMYVSTWYGLSVINLNDEYNSEGYYVGSARPTSTTPTTLISFDAEQTSDQSVSLQYRIGDSDAVWRNDFDDNINTEYIGDWGGWGFPFQTAIESGGTMKLSNPFEYTGYGESSGADGWIDTGMPDGYFPIGSKVTARVRINSDTREIADWYDYMFSDDWWDGSADEAIESNEWHLMSFTAGAKSFSKIGFEIGWKTGTWDPSDTFEIDWIQIELPESAGHWNPWSPECTNPYSCPIDPSDLVGNGWLQYKLNLSTTDRTTTPSVHSVTFSDGYESSGTYTSSEQTFTKSQDLLTFNADTVTPTGTNIDFSYSIDRGATWNNISPGDTFPKGVNLAKYFKWKANLSTNSATTTPVINSVSIDTTTHQNTISTSVATQAERLESQGKQAEADELKEKRGGGGGNHRPSDREVKQEIVTILEKAVVIIKRIREIEEGVESD